MSSLKQFNDTIYAFVDDLKKMNIQSMKSDIMKLDTFIDITKINARAILPHFQTQFLRDEFVRNILKNNVYFFVNYDASKEKIVLDGGDDAIALIKRIQSIVHEIDKKGNDEYIAKTLKWIKILCFHAYSDLNIDASAKFRSLMA